MCHLATCFVKAPFRNAVTYDLVRSLLRKGLFRASHPNDTCGHGRRGVYGVSPPGVTEGAIRRITASKPSRPASCVRQVRASCAGGLFLVLHPNIALGHDSVMYSLRYRSGLPQASFGAQLCQRPFLGSLRTLKYAPRLKRGASSCSNVKFGVRLAGNVVPPPTRGPHKIACGDFAGSPIRAFLPH